MWRRLLCVCCGYRCTLSALAEYATRDAMAVCALAEYAAREMAVCAPAEYGSLSSRTHEGLQVPQVVRHSTQQRL